MTNAITSTPSPGVNQPPRPAIARAADGDFKTKGAGHTVKDADGDYKPDAVASSPAAKVSASTQSALTSLVKGG